MGEVGVAILTGGRSSRMGADKWALPLDGGTFLSRLCVELSSFDERLLSVAPSSACRQEGWHVVEDERPGLGPIGGIRSALRACRSDALLIVACDMPWYRADHARATVEAWGGEDVLLPRAGGRLQPMGSLWAKTCLSAIEEAIAAGERRLLSACDRARARIIDVPDARAYGDVDTMEDLRALGT